MPAKDRIGIHKRLQCSEAVFEGQDEEKIGISNEKNSTTEIV